jgi:hypothetical protein
MNVDELFDTLCRRLDEEVERQRGILDLCVAQGEAARLHDIDTLEKKTGELARLLATAGGAAKERKALIGVILDGDDAGVSCHGGVSNLTAIIKRAPTAWREPLARVQASLKEALSESRAVVVANAGLLRASLKVVHESLRQFEHYGIVDSVAYDASGGEPVAPGACARLLNERG